MTDAPSHVLLRPARRRRGWIALAMVVVLIGGFVAVDARLKHAPRGGFVVPEATLRIETSNLPAVWSAFENSDVFGRINRDAPPVYHDLEVRMRRSTGIRWTPDRWRLWFGPGLYAAKTDAGDVVCLRPGVLVRAALLAARISGRIKSVDDVLEGDGIALTWREGYLLVGNTRAALESLRSTQMIANDDHGDNVVRIAWTSDPAGDIFVTFGAEPEIAGTLALRPPRELDRGTAMDAWPVPPIVSVSGVGGEQVVNAMAARWPRFPGSEVLENTLQEYLGLFPEGWGEDVLSFGWALFDVDASELLALPDAVLAIHYRDRPVFEIPPDAIPYQWSGARGWMMPWYGADTSLYVAESGNRLVFTNRERTMSGVQTRSAAGTVSSAGLVVEVDFRRGADIAQAIAYNAAENDLLPRYDRDDFNHLLVPRFRAFAALGAFRMDGVYTEEGLTFEGRFTPPPVEEVSAS